MFFTKSAKLMPKMPKKLVYFSLNFQLSLAK
jgi:hypothetical protein